LIENFEEKFKLGRKLQQGPDVSKTVQRNSRESVFKSLEWNDIGIQIGNKKLSNLRFVDAVLFSESKGELLRIVEELQSISKKVGSELNMAKTKIINNANQDNYLRNGFKIEVVEDDKYLGQTIIIIYPYSKLHFVKDFPRFFHCIHTPSLRIRIYYKTVFKTS
jgi:hypothetical protein